MWASLGLIMQPPLSQWSLQFQRRWRDRKNLSTMSSKRIPRPKAKWEEVTSHDLPLPPPLPPQSPTDTNTVTRHQQRRHRCCFDWSIDWLIDWLIAVDVATLWGAQDRTTRPESSRKTGGNVIVSMKFTCVTALVPRSFSTGRPNATVPWRFHAVVFICVVLSSPRGFSSSFGGPRAVSEQLLYQRCRCRSCSTGGFRPLSVQFRNNIFTNNIGVVHWRGFTFHWRFQSSFRAFFEQSLFNWYWRASLKRFSSHLLCSTGDFRAVFERFPSNMIIVYLLLNHYFSSLRRFFFWQPNPNPLAVSEQFPSGFRATSHPPT